MMCRCGNPLHAVPEHLLDYATWVCGRCSNQTDLPKMRLKIDRRKLKNAAFNPSQGERRVVIHLADLGL